MEEIPTNGFIYCYFEPHRNKIINFPTDEVEVYYGITNDVIVRLNDLIKVVSNEERLNADKLLISEDKNTYISCHGLLRSIISKKMKTDPLNVTFTYDIKNKPRILGNPFYFNISHARGAFAFAISKFYYLGIDIEKVDWSIEIMPLINSFYSHKERRFVLSAKTSMHDNFTLLWTRKEALLKAIGIGIVENLDQIEVSEKKNIIAREIVDNTIPETILNDHYIISEKVGGYYISIAMPQKIEVKWHQINKANINEYL
jgi:4'-phosphopantetheinyl transferase